MFQLNLVPQLAHKFWPYTTGALQLGQEYICCMIDYYFSHRYSLEYIRYDRLCPASFNNQ